MQGWIGSDRHASLLRMLPRNGCSPRLESPQLTQDQDSHLCGHTVTLLLKHSATDLGPAGALVAISIGLDWTDSSYLVKAWWLEAWAQGMQRVRAAQSWLV